MKSPVTFLQGIVSVIVLSIIGLIALIIFSGKIKFGMVDENYYEKDLQYQDQIDRIERAGELQEAVKIELIGNYISIDFPELFEPTEVSGEIKLYRPSDPQLDQFINILLDNEGRQFIETTRLKSGAWKLMLTWYYDDLDYYIEKRIFINN